MMDGREILLTNGPGPMLILTITPPFDVKRPHLCGKRQDILDFAQGLSELTDWPIIDRVNSPRKPQ